MRQLALAALAGLTLTVAAACGGDEPSGNTDRTAATPMVTGQAPATPLGVPMAVCDLLAVDAVSEFLGQPARVDESNPSECVWLADTRGTHRVHLQVYGQHSYFSPIAWGGTSEPIAGIGEEAFLIRGAVAGTVAAFWDGEHAVFLNYTVLAGGESSQDKADQLVELLGTIAEHI